MRKIVSLAFAAAVALGIVFWAKSGAVVTTVQAGKNPDAATKARLRSDLEQSFAGFERRQAVAR